MMTIRLQLGDNSKTLCNETPLQYPLRSGFYRQQLTTTTHIVHLKPTWTQLKRTPFHSKPPPAIHCRWIHWLHRVHRHVLQQIQPAYIDPLRCHRHGVAVHILEKRRACGEVPHLVVGVGPVSAVVEKATVSISHVAVGSVRVSIVSRAVGIGIRVGCVVEPGGGGRGSGTKYGGWAGWVGEIPGGEVPRRGGDVSWGCGAVCGMLEQRT